MKVNISNYPTDWLRSRIHYNYMDKKYGNDWYDNNTKFENFLERVEDTLQIFYNATINKVLKHRKRRINVRIDNCDIWNADNTLALIIHPMLIKIRDAKQGSPFTDDEDAPENLRSTAAKAKDNEWDTDEFHEARWKWILNEMIHSFECELDDDWDQQFYSGTIDHVIKKVEEVGGEKFSTFENGPNHTFVIDIENRKKAWDRRQEGLRLFSKYYHSLWT